MTSNKAHRGSEQVGQAHETPVAGGEDSVRRAIAQAFVPVRRFCFLQGGSWHEAEDIAQEALLRAWKGRARFDGRADPKTWIFAIARNCWRDRLRRKRRRPREHPMTEAMELTDTQPPPHAGLAREELGRAVRRALLTLPAEQREALALRESRGLKFRQVAEVLGVPVATAKSRVRYALLKLADELQGFRQEAR